MKKIFIIIFTLIYFGCSSNNGELVGVQDRNIYFEPEPYGMVFIPQGSFKMGAVEEDIVFSKNNNIRTVSVEAFWMDETEITNNEYRQFVYWVKDSIMRTLLSKQLDGYSINEDEFGNVLEPPKLIWNIKIDQGDEEVKEILSDLYYSGEERLYGRKEIDVSKLNYEYFWVDYMQAGNSKNKYNFTTKEYEGYYETVDDKTHKIKSRADFIVREIINVYPDTLCWISDFTYSYNEPYTKMYFWHTSYDNYPIVGINWKQARAFSIWRTNILNNYLSSNGEIFVQNYRLPLEAEWEYASRGGLENVKYPWGGPYARNNKGCFLANFKPMRGNYTDDGYINAGKVGSYEPNNFGLYDMAGNVSEWTENAYDESAYIYSDDMNQSYRYNAKNNDPPSLKRKVIRGGSWKDVAYYLQCGTRNYEYQDSSKSYIGFRCVRTYLGNN
jgi:formylglycine-generating enzyme required for sulfatase activity